MKPPNYYLPLPSPFGALGIIWQETENGPRVRNILLPKEQDPLDRRIAETIPCPIRRSCPPIGALGKQIQAFLDGQAIQFELDLLLWEACSPFQRSVLLAEREIPRGWVSTYGRIAQHLGVEGGARAVGNALARNPFPILIPCHRVIRANSELGGYQGGPEMKRKLLEMEGVEITARGRVLPTHLWSAFFSARRPLW